jgi:hypothetical protein
MSSVARELKAREGVLSHVYYRTVPISATKGPHSCVLAVVIASLLLRIIIALGGVGSHFKDILIFVCFFSTKR